MASPSPRGFDSDIGRKLAKSRRGHTKSRTGCIECKRRHIRCDERRPVCANCDMAERPCAYVPETLKFVMPVLSSRVRAPLRVPPEVSSPASTPNLTTGVEDGVTVNFLHLELLHNFTTETFIIGMGQDFPDPTRLMIDAALEAPYLMYEALAISARRLASLNRSRNGEYLHEAMLLQTRAVSLFNKDKDELNGSSCVARLLFSSLLGRHLLADTLANRAGSFESFLGRYDQFLRLHRSMRDLATDAQPYLMQSELAPAILWGTTIFDSKTTGHHCDGALDMLLSSVHLDHRSREACRQAVHFLQVGFDETLGGGSQWRAIHIIFWWSILISSEFVDLLVCRQPEAIVILGYYSALLHYGRNIWPIADAGNWLLNAIAQYLGSEWAERMAGPRALLLAAAS